MSKKLLYLLRTAPSLGSPFLKLIGKLAGTASGVDPDLRTLVALPNGEQPESPPGSGLLGDAEQTISPPVTRGAAVTPPATQALKRKYFVSSSDGEDEESSSDGGAWLGACSVWQL